MASQTQTVSRRRQSNSRPVIPQGQVKPNIRPYGIEVVPDTNWRDWRLRELRPEIRANYPVFWPPIDDALRANDNAERQNQINYHLGDYPARLQGFAPRSLDDLPLNYKPKQLQFRSLRDINRQVDTARIADRPRKLFQETDSDKLPAFWFAETSSDLFTRVWEFANDTFGHKCWGGQVNERDWTGYWINKLPADFIRAASVVARGDPLRGRKDGHDDHGYEFLFLNQANRIQLSTAVIAKLLEENCFDALLFGVTPDQKKALNLVDRTTDATADGYSRKMARYSLLHQYLTSDLFTDNFWPEVDRVTTRLLAVLLPLINMVGEYDDRTSLQNDKARWPTLIEVHQRLHNIVAEAAWLTNGTQLSRSCFWIEFPQPGQLWDSRQEHVIDTNWKDSIASATAPNDVRRTAKVQFAMWPFFERYFPHRQNTANGGGANDGDLTNTVHKAQVVYYAGGDTDQCEQWEDYTLSQHLLDWKKMSRNIFTRLIRWPFSGSSSAGPRPPPPPPPPPPAPTPASNAGQGATPGTGSGVLPGTGLGVLPGTGSGATPGAGSGILPGTGSGVLPGTGSGVLPSTGSGAIPGTGSGVLPGTGSGVLPGIGSGATPGTGSGVSSPINLTVIPALAGSGVPSRSGQVTLTAPRTTIDIPSSPTVKAPSMWSRLWAWFISQVLTLYWWLYNNLYKGVVALLVLVAAILLAKTATSVDWKRLELSSPWSWPLINITTVDPSSSSTTSSSSSSSLTSDDWSSTSVTIIPADPKATTPEFSPGPGTVTITRTSILGSPVNWDEPSDPTGPSDTINPNPPALFSPADDDSTDGGDGLLPGPLPYDLADDSTPTSWWISVKGWFSENNFQQREKTLKDTERAEDELEAYIIRAMEVFQEEYKPTNWEFFKKISEVMGRWTGSAKRDGKNAPNSPCGHLDDDGFCVLLHHFMMRDDDPRYTETDWKTLYGVALDPVNLRNFWQKFREQTNEDFADRAIIDMSQVPWDAPETQAELDEIKTKLTHVLHFAKWYLSDPLPLGVYKPAEETDFDQGEKTQTSPDSEHADTSQSSKTTTSDKSTTSTSKGKSTTESESSSSSKSIKNSTSTSSSKSAKQSTSTSSSKSAKQSISIGSSKSAKQSTSTSSSKSAKQSISIGSSKSAKQSTSTSSSKSIKDRWIIIDERRANGVSSEPSHPDMKKRETRPGTWVTTEFFDLASTCFVPDGSPVAATCYTTVTPEATPTPVAATPTP